MRLYEAESIGIPQFCKDHAIAIHHYVSLTGKIVEFLFILMIKKCLKTTIFAPPTP